MEKENNILITLGNPEDTSSEKISQVKLMSLYKIEEACQSYNSNIDYLQVLANLLCLTKRIKRKKRSPEISEKTTRSLNLKLLERSHAIFQAELENRH